MKTDKILCLALAAALCLTLAACGGTATGTAGGEQNMAPGGGGGNRGGEGGAQQAASSAISVNVKLPSLENLSLTTDYIGTIEAAESVNVYPKSGGTVSAIYFEAGQTVQEGDLLFVLDDEDAARSLAEAKLTYEVALNNIEVQESGSSSTLTELQYQNNITRARQSYETARENLEMAVDNDDFSISDFRKFRNALKEAEEAYNNEQNEETWKTYQDAYEKYMDNLEDYGSYSTQKSLYTAFENAYIAYEQELEAYEIYKKMISGENTTSYELQRQQAQLRYESAQKDYDNTRVYAPISGVIESKSVAVHENVSTNTAAYVISNKDTMAVKFNVSADGVGALQLGDEVVLTKGQMTYTAAITEIDSKANNVGLFPVTAYIDSENALLSGIAVKVTAATASAENAMIVSVNNISYQDQKPYVFVYDPITGTAVQTFIELGITTREYAQVVSGLQASSQVITTWHPDLADGVAVTLRSEG